MADEKKLNNEELTDEQLKEAAGGAGRPIINERFERDTCYKCQTQKSVSELIFTTINGQRRRICFKCAGVR